jgi:fibronectin-binding autotransporter adhesin
MRQSSFDPLEEDTMIDRTIPASDGGRKRGAKMLRRAIAVLLATTALGGGSAHAVDGTWIGSGDEWTDPTNWSSNPSVPDGTATFTVNTPTAVQSNGFVGIGSVQFTQTPNAAAYTITTNDVFVVNGAGVSNNSTNTQTFVTASTTLFQNSSTASGGSKTVSYFNVGAMLFQNSSTAGTATITNNSSLEFDNTSTAGAAKITNNVVADFFDSSSAGTSQTTNTTGATLTFHDNSTAGGSTITNSGAVAFLNSSSAGSASLSTTGGSFATITFNDTSTAGNSNIALVDGTLTFNNSSTAANATITNNSGGTTTFGVLGGTDTSNAGTSHITNNNSGITNFLAHTSAMNATIANNSGGNTNFQNQSTAGNATIVNNSGGTTTFGVMLGTDTASAGSSVIINNSGGTTAFFAATTAGSATIINSLGGIVQFGDSGGANDTATAGNSTIDNSGVVSFNSKTTAGTATITTHSGGNVVFFDTSSGGGARFITDAGGTVDISALTSAGTTAGSIEGAGSYVLGAKNFAVGSNNQSTQVSGVISGVGGSLTKVGTGTLILSGTNTYSGGTTISAGTLQLGNGGATGSIVGNIVDNGTLAVNRSNAVTLSGMISGSGAFRQIGAGTTTLTNTNTYTGPTTVTAGTLAISATGSITSNVTNNATFTNAGTVTGSLTNTGTASNTGIWNGNVQSNSGTINNSLTWTGTILNTSGTFNNNAPGTVSGLVTNVATTTNSGTLNGGLWNATGTTTNSGTINGGATVLHGTLNTNSATSVINGGLNNSETVNARNQVNGVIVNQSGGTFNVTGNLAGNNSFTSSGTLLVSGGNFTGITSLTNNSSNATGISVSATRTLSTTGTVTNAANANIEVSGTFTAGQLLTNAGVIMVNNGGTLNATVGGITNSGSITVALGGTVNDDLNNAGVVTNSGVYNAIVATNAGSIMNTATGTWTGNVLNNAVGITNNGIWIGNVVSSSGTFKNTQIINGGSWIGTVSNAGTFNNNAGATLSGLLTNTGGFTTNNGALNGGADVSGGRFSGSGTVTNLNVSGGIFAPGNGTPGTFMTVTGNLAFQSGAMYLVTLNPTTASFASVGGTATLNGTAAALYLAGNYISKKYTILSAAGGVSGTFGSLDNTNVPANFTSTLSYDANNAYIDLTLNFVPNPAPNFGPGLNINQQNVANTLVNFFNTTGGIPLAFGALTPAGLTQVSGELGTGVIQSSIKANDMFLNLLLDPTVAGRAGGFASGPAASQFAADDEEALAYAAKRKASSAERDAYAMATKAPYLAPQPLSRWSVWGAAYGGSAVTDGNATVGSHDTTARAYGIVAGADYKVTPDTLIGFALAGGGTSFSIASALGSGSSDLFQAGVFGRQNIGAAYLSAALAYGWQDVTTNRTVTVAGTDLLQARFKAETFSARFEGGYRFATPFAGITPYVAAQAISFNLPAYAEQVLAGTGTFALNYGAQTTTATRTELGLRSDKSFAVQDGIFTLRGRAAWAHDYNSDRAVTAVFQTLPGASFVVNGARGNPDGALVSAGAEMKWLNGFSLAATFEGEFSGNLTSYAGKGVAKYTW